MPATLQAELQTDPRLEQNGSRAELFIYCDIDRWSTDPEYFIAQLESLKDIEQIDVRISSSGGSYFIAHALYGALVRHPAKIVTHVDGMALSAASVVLCAGDEMHVAAGAPVMIHDPRLEQGGTIEQLESRLAMLRETREAIVGIYADRTGQSREQIEKWMAAETWFFGESAKAAGFATHVTPNKTLVAAHVDPDQWTNKPNDWQPPELSAPEPEPSTPPETEDPSTMTTKANQPDTPQAATAAEIKAACKGASSDFVLAQLEAGATEAQAVRAYNDELQQQLAAKDAAHEKELADAKAKADQDDPPGVDPLASGKDGGSDPGEDGDAVELFNDAVDKVLAKNPRLDRSQAVDRVISRDPTLHQNFLLATNSGSKAKRQLSEKFEHAI